jgi:NAD(P)-dependent dehydrogenase (short-subunit alcohol dehydrogenase family)
MKTLLITGVSRGIGKATAAIFIERGWQVIGTSTSGKAPLAGKNLEMHKLDFLADDSIKEFAGLIKRSGAKIDVMINNAGISLDKSDKITQAALKKTLQVNLIGLIELTEDLLDNVSDGGHIINISSTVGSFTGYSTPYAPSYAISKVALNMYTRILAGRLSGRNITVSSVHPGWVKTDMGGSMAPRTPAVAAENIYNIAISKIESGFFWYDGRKTDW